MTPDAYLVVLRDSIELRAVAKALGKALCDTRATVTQREQLAFQARQLAAKVHDGLAEEMGRAVFS